MRSNEEGTNEKKIFFLTFLVFFFKRRPTWPTWILIQLFFKRHKIYLSLPVFRPTVGFTCRRDKQDSVAYQPRNLRKSRLHAHAEGDQVQRCWVLTPAGARHPCPQAPFSHWQDRMILLHAIYSTTLGTVQPPKHSLTFTPMCRQGHDQSSRLRLHHHPPQSQ